MISDADNSIVEVTDVTITNAALGQQTTVDFSFTLKETIGQNPILKISFATPDGQPVNCIHLLIPKELRLCGGDTKMEEEVTVDWNNECPIQEGEHSASLSVYLPKMSLAKMCVGHVSSPVCGMARESRELKLCGGDTEMEQEVAADWNNQCPIQEGQHNIRLSVNLPNIALAKQCVGDGQLVVTFEVEDQGSLVDCVTFPFSVGVGGSSRRR
ncbi:hypothetical protein MTO96_042536 [Rhipicephalus appendiculatus]